MSRAPRRSSKKSTPAQLERQNRFTEAAAYGRSVMNDPIRSERYRPFAEARRRTIYQVAMTDYLKPPVISDIDLAAFFGQVGDAVDIRAEDDTEVVSVAVVLRKCCGATLEEGQAQPFGCWWRYTVRGSFPPDEVITVHVTVRDLAGNETTVRRIITPPIGNNHVE